MPATSNLHFFFEGHFDSMCAGILSTESALDRQLFIDHGVRILSKPFAALSPLEGMRLRLLTDRTWRYLRYLHFREALLLVPTVESVLVVGAGKGLAEIALAIEFPAIHFLLTDLERAPALRHAQALAQKYRLANVSFAHHDILQPGTMRADLVASTEVLEHVADTHRAAAHMSEMAIAYVYCLVPFAKASAQAETSGEPSSSGGPSAAPAFDPAGLEKHFPGTLHMRGCYWRNAGSAFRQKLHAISDEQIAERRKELEEEAENDIRLKIPASPREAQGIWTLSHV